MIGQANFYKASPTKGNSHKMTMSKIAARLREVHAKMQQKEPLFLSAEKDDTRLIHERLDEISRALITDYRNRCKQEDIILTSLASLHTQLHDAQKEKGKSATVDISVPAFPIDEICARLEERFFKHQQDTLLSISEKIDRLSQDLHKATITTQQPKNLEMLGKQVQGINQHLKDKITERPRDWQEALSTLLKNIPVHTVEPKQAKPFDTSASARLIDSARKTRQMD